MGDGSSIRYDRKRAVALKALDARELVKARLPEVAKSMTNAQFAEMQRVLDAAVVNPAVLQEHAEMLRRSVVKESKPGGNYRGGYHNGQPVLVDVNVERRANRIFEQQIPFSESDKRIRLNPGELLTADAFALTTNNPDEAEFLEKLQEWVENGGIWLHFEPKRVRDPESPSSHIIDPRNFEVWLSLGKVGGQIETSAGTIDRKALLSSVGAAYYRSVYQGPFLKRLDKLRAQVFEEIQAGQQEHMEWDAHRNLQVTPLVPKIADWAGGATWASPKVWDKAWELYHYGWSQQQKGDVLGAMQTTMVAAMMAQILALKLEEYISKTTGGAAKVVKIALVVATVATLIDGTKLFHALGVGLLRRWAMRAAAAEVRIVAKKSITKAAAPPYKGPEAYQRTHYAGPETVKHGTVKVKPFDPKATQVSNAGVGDFINVEEADWIRRGEGWFKDYTTWLIKNADASLADKLAELEKSKARWNYYVDW